MCATIAKKEHSNNLCCLVIFGSPHKNGATGRLAQEFLNALPENTAVNRIDCFDHAPLPCNDCGACYHREGCSLKDLDYFYALLENADILVFAAPVYNLSFPAPMKALIDRTQRYWSARFIQGKRPPVSRPKRTLLITTCGSESTEGGDMLERQLKPVLTVLNAKLMQAIHYSGADKSNPIDPYLLMVKDAADLFIL